MAPWCAKGVTREGVTLLYGPSICTRSVQMDLRRSQVLRPFLTQGYTVGRRGVPAGQVRLLPAPMDGVPYPQPLTGDKPHNVPWGVLLVRPIGQPPRPVPPGAADKPSWAYPTLLRVLRWGRYSHRGGGPNPSGWAPRLCPLWAPFIPSPPSRCVGLGGGSLATPGLGAAVVLGGGGSPLLAEVLVCASPPLLAGASCRWWWVVPRHSWLRVLGAVPSNSWLGSAGGAFGGGPSPLLAEVRRFVGRG